MDDLPPRPLRPRRRPQPVSRTRLYGRPLYRIRRRLHPPASNAATENGIFYGDTPEYVDFAYVANVCRVNLVALAGLASAPAQPKDFAFSSNRQSADTELKWDAVAAADLAGYEVVWRDTTSPEWTNSEFAGNVTTYTVKAKSKDNYFFGVRSVDKAGNKSMVTYQGGR